jgi:hypothetical protein
MSDSTVRTSAAIGMALAAGVPVGLFLNLSAVPFGPILVGWFVTLAGGVIITAGLCILATSRYVVVGLAYAASVAATVVVVSHLDGCLLAAAQFASIFAIAGAASLLGSLTCWLLKWEDKKARELTKSQAPIPGQSNAVR